MSWRNIKCPPLSSFCNVFLFHFFRRSVLETFCKKSVLKNFEKFTGKHLYLSFSFIKIEALVQVFSLEFCETFNNNFFCRTPLVATSASSEVTHVWETLEEWQLSHWNFSKLQRMCRRLLEKMIVSETIFGKVVNLTTPNVHNHDLIYFKFLKPFENNRAI